MRMVIVTRRAAYFNRLIRKVFVGVSFHELGSDGSHEMVDDAELHQRHEDKNGARGHPNVDAFHVRDRWQRALRLRALRR